MAAATALLAAAQLAVPAGRITQPVSNAATVTLTATHPAQLALATADLGAAPSDMPLERMLLVLRRPGQKELALEQLLDEQREAGSPRFRQWLSPEQVGAQFGPDPADVTAVEQWLQASGFSIQRVAAGGVAIEFSGTAGNVASAFHTQLHHYLVNGTPHWANASDEQIPAGLAPVAAGVLSLNDFRQRGSDARIVGFEPILPPSSDRGQLTYQDANGNLQHAMAPADMYSIYNVWPLLPQTHGAAGETIALVARSDVNLNDISEFRQNFLPSTYSGSFTQIEDGADPGIVTDGDDAEATLDSEWASAAAPGAAVKLVVSEPTDTTDGVDLSALYIVDNDLAPVMSTSFGNCEATFGPVENAFWDQLWEQAAAEGISSFVSSGDSGAAGCDDSNNAIATGGLGISGAASPPWDTAVGGTQFNENLVPGNYWATSNGPEYGSASGYIPETAWEEKLGSNGGPALWSSSGGASSIYPKPAWQSGMGVPADNARDIPDVSLTAAGHDGYVVCFENSCAQGIFGIFGGTSASSPTMAGLMAQTDAKLQAAQGNANPVLYALANQQSTQATVCSAQSPPAANCIYHDVVSGNNIVPCQAGTTGCGADGTMGYSAGAGFDLVTGWGSVNASNLANAWTGISFDASNTSLTLSPPANLQHGQAVPVSMAVTGVSGGPTPTGTVELLAQFTNGATAPVQTFTLDGTGAAQGTTAQLPGGTYNVVARYSGDLKYGSSLSSATGVIVAPEASVTTATAQVYDLQGNATPAVQVPYGALYYIKAQVAGASGVGTPTGTVSYSGSNIFGKITLDANGQAPLPFPYTSPAAGPVSFTAAYSGDASFNPSTSPAVTFTVVPATTSMTLSTSPDGEGGTELLAVMATQAYTGLPPTGQVSFFSGGTLLGKGWLGFSSTDAVTKTIKESASISATTLGPVATANLTVQYPGDGNYAASTAGPVSIVTPAYVTFNPPSLDFGVVQFGTTATMTTVMTNAGGTPLSGGFGTGELIYYRETNNCAAGGLSPGQSCTLTFTFTPPFPGEVDGGFGIYGVGGSINLTATVPGFTLGGEDSPAPSVTAGQTVQLPVTLFSQGGFSGSVTLACATNFTPASTCTAPPPVMVPAGGSATANLTLTTTAPPAATASGWEDGGWWWLGGAGGIALMLALGSGRKRRHWVLVPAGLALLLAAAACGGGGGGGGLGLGGGGGVSPPPPSAPGVSPASLNFGSVGVNQTAAAQVVTLSNNGGAGFDLAKVMVSNPQFSASTNCTSVAAGSSCPINVTFTPASGGLVTGTMQLEFGSLWPEVSVGLTGTGSYSYTPPGAWSVNFTATAGAQTANGSYVFIVH